MEQNQNNESIFPNFNTKLPADWKACAEIPAAVVAVVEYENVYGTEYLRIGDEVVMNMDKEARGWGRKGVPDGTKGTVVGFFEYYDTYNLNRSQNPGIYRGNGAAVVQWETGEADTHGSDLAMPKWLIDARRLETKHNEAFKKMVKMYDLPKFDYMVGNKIAYTWKPDPRHGHHTPKREIGTITAIDFDEIIERRTGQLLDSKKWGYDRVIHVDIEGGGSTRISHAEIDELIEKGNYWAWTHDSTQLKFKDLQEEVKFYTSMRKRHQLRSPRTGDYKWELEDALEAIKRGDADAIGTSGSMFGSTPFTTVYRFDSDLAVLAERCRAETLKGFAEHQSRELPNKKYLVTYTLPGTEHTITATKEFDNSVYIKPTATERFVLEDYDYKIVPSFNTHEKEDDPVILRAAVLEPDVYPMLKKGDGTEERIDLSPEIRKELAVDFFNRLAEKGWTVDDSKFIKQ